MDKTFSALPNYHNILAAIRETLRNRVGLTTRFRLCDDSLSYS